MACNQGETHSGALAIKYSATDSGTRPIEPCTGFWSGPNIWLEGGVDLATAKVGVPNTVRVRVHNITAAPIADVNVEAWVCNFTAGVGPSGGIPSAGGTLPLTGFVGSIAGNSSQVVTCGPPWTPLASDVATYNGHVCLAANCFSDGGDGVTVVGGSLKICCDSHHGQRNIAIKAVRSRGGKMSFRFQAANPDLKEEELFILEVIPVRGRGAFGVAERQQFKSGPLNGLKLAKSRFRPLALQLAGEGIEPGAEIKIELRPNEPRDIELYAEFNPEEAIGNFHTFDVVERTIDGEVVGGARILAVIAPDKLAKD